MSGHAGHGDSNKEGDLLAKKLFATIAIGVIVFFTIVFLGIF